MSDYVCRRCGCQCASDGSKHTAGGPGMKSCGKPPVPVLRSELEAESRAMLGNLNRPLYSPTIATPPASDTTP